MGPQMMSKFNRFFANYEQLTKIKKEHDRCGGKIGMHALDNFLANCNQNLTNRALDGAYKRLGIVDYDPKNNGQGPSETHKRAEKSRAAGRK